MFYTWTRGARSQLTHGMSWDSLMDVNRTEILENSSKTGRMAEPVKLDLKAKGPNRPVGGLFFCLAGTSA